MEKILDILGLQFEVIFVLGISFIILVIVLNKVLFKPLMKHLDERSNEIKGNFDKIALDKKEIERLTEEYKTKLTQIEQEAYQKVQEAIKEGLKVKTEIISEAHAQSDNVLRKAKKEIEHEKEKALVELRNEMVSLSLAAARKVIEKEIDEQTHRKLVENFLDDLSKTATH